MRTFYDHPGVIMDKNKMNETILNLALEIICLLTGEDYTVVKKTSENYVIPKTYPNSSGGWSRSRDAQRNNVQNLLDLARNMVELLTGEVPIRCQDVAVYFSMEEWEYVEGHKDQYQDMMEDQQPHTLPAGFANEDQNEELNPSASSLSYRKLQDNGNVQGIAEEFNSRNREQDDLTAKTHLSRKVEEKLQCDRGNLTKPEIHDPVRHTMGGSHFMVESCNERNFTNAIERTPKYTFTHIKEEPVSYDGENVSEANIYRPTGHTPQDTTLIKEEPASHDGGDLTDPTQYRFLPIKEEPDTSDGRTVMDLNISTPTDYTQLYTTIKRETLSCNEDNTYTPIDHIQGPSPYIKEEPLSCDNTYAPIDHIQYPSPHIKDKRLSCAEDLTESNTYTPTDHRQHQNPHINEEPAPYDGGNLTDSYVYAPTDQTQYILLPVEGEPSNDGTLIDLNDIPRDYTLHPTTHTKEETVSCHKENLIDHDGHLPIDYTHPSTHIKGHDEDVTDTNHGTFKDLTQHLFPHVEKEPGSFIGESLMEMDIRATVDGTQQYGSTRMNNGPIPTDQTQYTSREEPAIKESSFQQHKSPSPGEPEAKDSSEKRKKEIEQNYIDLTVRSKKFLCTVQQTTNSFEIIYNCPDCPACFTSNVDLARHQLNHTGSKPFVCCLCGRCFGSKTDLVVHQVFHGRDPDRSMHPSRSLVSVDGTEQYRPPPVNNKPDYNGGNSTHPDCSKTSDYIQQYPSTEKPVLEETSSLQKHESSLLWRLENKGVYTKRKKPLEKNYNKVTESSKKFCTIQQTTDSFQILYNCPECPEFFTSNLDLAKHQIIHAGGMSIICSICGMSFGRKSDLLVHQITHGGKY